MQAGRWPRHLVGGLAIVKEAAPRRYAFDSYSLVRHFGCWELLLIMQRATRCVR
jgi:hypothetical protein